MSDDTGRISSEVWLHSLHPEFLKAGDYQLCQVSFDFQKKPILRRTAKAAGGSAERRAARKRLASVKAAMKNKTKEGLATEASGQEAERIFEGGFFRIESPAKLFPGQSRPLPFARIYVL